MPRTPKKTPSADEIAEKASRGENVSAYFTNKFTVVKPVHRVNVDLTQGMLRELDERAARLNVSRQSHCQNSTRPSTGRGPHSRTSAKDGLYFTLRHATIRPCGLVNTWPLGWIYRRGSDEAEFYVANPRSDFSR